MRDISLHLLDIVENSFEAGADIIEIGVVEDLANNTLRLSVKDNGSGLDPQQLARATDPFYTTKDTKRVGLGIPLLAQASREAGGEFRIQSRPGRGTTINASFIHDHIDRKPLGDIPETLVVLIASRGGKADILYTHQKNGNTFSLDTRELKRELGDLPITQPDVLSLVKEKIKDGLGSIPK